MSSESPPPQGIPLPSGFLSHDAVTGLPWFSALLPSAATFAQAQETQVIYLQLNGLVEVGAVYGDRIAQLLFRQLVRRLRSLLDPRELVGRDAGASLVILTARPPAELQGLASSISRQVKAVAILTRGVRLPEARIGVANVRPAADHRDAIAAIEAAVTAAEQAALGQEALEGPLAPGISEPVRPQEKSPEPQPPAVRATPDHGPSETIVIRRIGIAMEGAEATATITLTWGTKEAEAEAIGTNTPRDRLVLVGNATATAVMMLTPKGGTVSRVIVDEISQENDRFVRAVVEITGPGGLEQMSATVPIQGTTYSTVARAVVQAMEPRIREIMGTS